MSEYLKRKYGLILFLIILVAMVLTYWFGIRWLFANIRSERDAIQEMLVIREDRSRQLGKLEEYADQHDVILDNESTMDIFTDQEHMIEFVERLESLAGESGVEIVIEARDPIVPPKMVKKSTTNTNVSATTDKDTKKEGEPDDGKSKETTSDSGNAKNAPNKKVKKGSGILENLPSDSYTHLGLRIIGETQQVITYLHRVENMPVALDVIAIDAMRKEKPAKERVSPGAASLPSTPISDTSGVAQSEVNTNTLDVPEPVPVHLEVPENDFVLELVADLIVYHFKR